MNIKGENFLVTEPYILNKNYLTAKEVIWEDVIQKISDSHDQGVELNSTTGPLTVIFDKRGPHWPPSFLCENFKHPPTLQKVYDEVEKDFEIQDMHVYSSFAKDSGNFEKHEDEIDVLIVQSIGTMSYIIEGINDIVVLNPGEGVFIPKFTNHQPIVHGPRVTISFGIKDKK